MKKTGLTILLVIGIAACQDGSRTVQPVAQPPVGIRTARETGPVPGQYIIVFNENVNNTAALARQLAGEQGATVQFTYGAALKGFAAQMSDAAAAALARNPDVAYVEQDQVVSAIADEAMDANGDPWGLDRIDAASGLDRHYLYTLTGAGVTAYIIDTGIRTTHSEFGGRASGGYTAIADANGTNDCNGHGTHVSGTVGGSTYGVAKAVTLVAVRVLDCGGSGTVSGVIAGIDWVTANHAARAVANMSLGGGASTSLDQAVQNSINSGVSYAIAAGNGNFFGIAQNACNYSPARVAAAMTIGATSKNDAKTSWSNYGSCVDWFAPGENIKSAWKDSDTATNTISGTSMATPHTTGVAALYLEANPAATPQEVRDGLYAATTKGIVTNSSTTNNDLLYTPPAGFGAVVPPPPPGPDAPPVASYAWSCTSSKGRVCNFNGTGSTDDNGISSYSWAFGDGATGSGATVNHRFANGTYNVTLTVRDAANQAGVRTCAVQTGTTGACTP